MLACACNEPEEPPVETAGECEAGAGTIAFSAGAFSAPETLGTAMTFVTVERTDGSAGPAYASVVLTDGTAVRDVDYYALQTQVSWEDGESGPRVLLVGLVGNFEHEGSKTLTVGLADPTCAALGELAAATLTIDDDDEEGFTIGGTVTGLVDGALLLSLNSAYDVGVVADGAFVFPLSFPAGTAYDVVVRAQPAAQTCEVTNGTGVVAAAVTTIVVTCGPVSTEPVVLGPEGFFNVRGIARQSEGKLVVAGGGQGDFSVVRYLTDGTVDMAFGTAGKATAAFPNNRPDEARAIAIQADGKIVVVGGTRANSTTNDFAIARFLGTGALDPSFGTGGLVITDFAGMDDVARDVVIQPDGKIVAAGSARNATTQNDFAVVRYLATGDLDPAFGTGGLVQTQVAGNSDLGTSVALSPSGKIIVAGGATDQLAVVRYTAAGVVDPTFNGGIATVDLDTVGSNDAVDVAVLPNESILVGGYATLRGGDPDFIVARFASDGLIDSTYGTGGTLVVDLTPQDFARAMALYADGSLVIVGQTEGGDLYDISAVFVSPTGSLVDTRTVTLPGADPRAVLVHPDGTVVIAGDATNGAGRSAAIVRLAP